MLEWENVEKPVENGPFESPIHFDNLGHYLGRSLCWILKELFVLVIIASICIILIVFGFIPISKAFTCFISMMFVWYISKLF